MTEEICSVCKTKPVAVKVTSTGQFICLSCCDKRDRQSDPLPLPGPPPLANFVQYPGFCSIERRFTLVKHGKWEFRWLASADPYPDGKPLGKLISGHGPTLTEALRDWAHKARPYMKRPSLFKPDPMGHNNA